MVPRLLYLHLITPIQDGLTAKNKFPTLWRVYNHCHIENLAFLYTNKEGMEREIDQQTGKASAIMRPLYLLLRWVKRPGIQFTYHSTSLPSPMDMSCWLWMRGNHHRYRQWKRVLVIEWKRFCLEIKLKAQSFHGVIPFHVNKIQVQYSGLLDVLLERWGVWNTVNCEEMVWKTRTPWPIKGFVSIWRSRKKEPKRDI